jgi:hypothetical protein
VLGTDLAPGSFDDDGNLGVDGAGVCRGVDTAIDPPSVFAFAMVVLFIVMVIVMVPCCV